MAVRVAAEAESRAGSRGSGAARTRRFSRAVLKRLLSGLLTLVLVSVITFALLLLVPGDPAVSLAGENPTAEQVEQIRTSLGLDKPVVVQYLTWAGSVLTGDFGTSLYSQQPVIEAIAHRLPVTLSLIAGALVLALVVGGGLGLWGGLKYRDKSGAIIAAAGTFAMSIPPFVLGMLLVLVFALTYPVLPATGYVPFSSSPTQWFLCLVLPWVALAGSPIAAVAGQARSAVIGVLGQDYIRTARAKGLSRKSIITRHVARNSLMQVVTVLGGEIAVMIGATVVVEQLFALNGLGSLIVESVFRRDFPVVQGVVLTAAAFVVVVNMVIDLSYSWLNPKVRTA